MGESFKAKYPGRGITAERIFAYTYAVLHDPVYRDKYAVDLTQEFPRLPLYHDFDAWARMGQELLDLHIGFESAEPYPLQIVEKQGDAKRVFLRPGKERGSITLDDKTTLTGVPPIAWRYQLGSRSAMEWVLDQYKEKKPRDPTIAEKFNTYRFADYKERVIDLLKRVCTVSVRTMEIVDAWPTGTTRASLLPLETGRRASRRRRGFLPASGPHGVVVLPFDHRGELLHLQAAHLLQGAVARLHSLAVS